MSKWRVREKQSKQLTEQLTQLVNERIDKFADKLYELNTLLYETDDSGSFINFYEMSEELYRTFATYHIARASKFNETTRTCIRDILKLMTTLASKAIIGRLSLEDLKRSIQITKENNTKLYIDIFIKDNEDIDKDVLRFSIQQILDKLDDVLIKFNKHANRFIGHMKAALKADFDVSKIKKFYHPEGGPFGHFVWPRKRIGIHASIENDTELEVETYYAFSRYIARNESNELTPKIIATVRQFLANGMYTDVFTKPNTSKIYRGMSLHPKAGIQQRDLINILNSAWSFTYKPRDGKLSSWTSSYKSAMEFTKSKHKSYENEDEETVTRIVLSVDTDELNRQNKLLDCKKLYNFKPMDGGFREEREIIAFGEIPITDWEILK